MRKILAIITILLFLLLLWCTKEKYETCCGDNNTQIVNDANNQQTNSSAEKDATKNTATIKKEALMYLWNSGDAILDTDLWTAKKDAILSELKSGKTLQIVGPYFEEENKEIGITRAENAFEKLGGKNLNLKSVEFTSKLVKFYDDAKTNAFGGTDFYWQIRNKNIQQVGGKTLIYFPSNSTKKLSNVNILNYLKDVATSLKDNEQKVDLSGHTDSRGNDLSNKKLALGRANSIKIELVNLGLSEDRISTISYGEEKPIADNNTASGRQKNRRVELEIK